MGNGIIDTKFGIESKVQTPTNAVVLEKYDSRNRDYDAKGYFLFFATGTVASNVVTVNLDIVPGAKVFAFPMIPYTVSTANQIVFDTTEYADSGNISDGNEIQVMVWARQSDLKLAGQPH